MRELQCLSDANLTLNILVGVINNFASGSNCLSGSIDSRFHNAHMASNIPVKFVKFWKLIIGEDKKSYRYSEEKPRREAEI